MTPFARIRAHEPPKKTLMVLIGWPIGLFSDIVDGKGKKQGFWISDLGLMALTYLRSGR
jgi:hypothetical protein